MREFFNRIFFHYRKLRVRNPDKNMNKKAARLKIVLPAAAAIVGAVQSLSVKQSNDGNYLLIQKIPHFVRVVFREPPEVWPLGSF